MSGNHATRRKAMRAKHLAAYREDGRFASMTAFIEATRIVEVLCREEPTFSPGAIRLGDQVLSFDAANMTLREIASKINATAQGFSASIAGIGTITVSGTVKGTSNVSTGSTSSKR